MLIPAACSFSTTVRTAALTKMGPAPRHSISTRASLHFDGIMEVSGLTKTVGCLTHDLSLLSLLYLDALDRQQPRSYPVQSYTGTIVHKADLQNGLLIPSPVQGHH